jgi:hypothetical protein
LLRRLHGKSRQRRVVGALNFDKGDRVMRKVLAAIVIIASFLFVAPVIESSSPGSTALFVAIGNAEGGGGGE